MNTLRYTLRGFRTQPGFAFITTLLLAVGIGANCVIFSALNAVLLRPLPVRDPKSLYRVVTNLPTIGKRGEMPYSVFAGLRDHAGTLENVVGEAYIDAAFTGDGLAERIRVNLVTPDYFAGLGVTAQIGRVLGAQDSTGVVLSHGFWQRRFSGDPAILGRTIHIAAQSLTVIGVLPRSFSGFSIDAEPDVRVPLVLLPQIDSSHTKPEQHFLEIAVRVRPGVSIARAQSEVLNIWRESQKWDAQARWQRDFGAQLDPLLHGVSRLRDRFSSALVILAGAVGLLLLMVCGNVAGLLLARSAARRPEIAVRLALGASRGRLVRQMLAETLLLASIGGAAGFALAYAAAPLLERAMPPVRDFGTVRLPLALHFSPDVRVLWFSLALCVVTAVLAGLTPALAASRQDLHSTLRAAKSSATWRGRRALVVFEVALCTLLLAGAGLLVRTFRELDQMDAGFDRRHIVTFTTDPNLNGYDGTRANAMRIELETQVRALPGVEAVGTSGMGLMRGTGMKSTIAARGQQVGPSEFLNSSFQMTTPEYFDAMGMRLLSGRVFTVAEADRQPIPTVINETFARKFFPGLDPLGRCFGNAMNAPAKCTFEVTGVVNDARYRSLREPIQPVFYRTFNADSLTSPSSFVLCVRTRVQPESIIQPVREILRSLDPALPFVEVHTLNDEAGATLWAERLTAALSSIFAAIAAFLAAAGLYGLLAYAVAQRSREIGIRMALGADPTSIARMIGADALTMVGLGVVVGLVAALAIGPAIRGVLYGVQPGDPKSFALAAALVLVTSAVAVAIPLARATRVDPAVTLRQD